MFRYYSIYAKELKRVKSEESYFKGHNALWKYFWQWKKLSASNSVKAKLPWISFPVIDFLNQVLTPSSKVFEYGGGGSTLFFAERAAEVVTVEHNKEWFEILKKSVKHKNWAPLFVEAEPAKAYRLEDAPDPDKYVSTETAFAEKTFFNYASAIDAYADEYFDVVLVDGRARPSCIKHGIPKLKKGGYLVLDNSDRAYYTQYFTTVLEQQFEIVINHSGPTPFCTWFNRTSVWRKK